MLRQAINPTNRATFADNVVKFLADEGLEGADFNWKYLSNPANEGAIGKPHYSLSSRQRLTREQLFWFPFYKLSRIKLPQESVNEAA